MASLVFAATAAESAKPAIKTNFPKQPDAARKALRAAVGKPFSEGWVFIDGQYLEPPYKVERFGNVIRINGIQVTGEVIPWSSFIRTQKGVKVTRSESAPAEGESPEPEPEPEPEIEDADDAWENSLDDLFDDEPAAKKPAKKSGGYKLKPRVKKPTVTVSYSFDGEFEHNEKTKELLGKINAYRTKIDSNLRSGGCYCFSSRYRTVALDVGATRHVLEHLPDLMKQNTTFEAFSQAVHAANIPFPEPLIEDVFRHRFDFLRIKARYTREKENRQWLGR